MIDAPLQLPLFPERVRLTMWRQIARGPGDVRRRRETLTGTVLERHPGQMRVLFDGAWRGNGSCRGCCLWVTA
jgi:hypothetical protein